MEREEKLAIIASDIIGLALNFEADTSITIADLKSAYVAAEDKFKVEAATNFDSKVSEVQKLLGTMSSDTEIIAKAAAYDRVKQIAHEFVQRCTNGTRGILNEAGLSDHLKQMEAAFEAANTVVSTPTAISPAQYITLLEQTVQQKDAEIAQLRQQLQQKEAEIAQLKAAQVPTPTP